MNRSLRVLIPVLILTVVSTTTLAQRGFGRRPRSFDPANVDRGGVPVWEGNKDFKSDLFVFARCKYSSGGGGWGVGRWLTDFPDSDLNFSFRLHELTSLEVDPHGKIVELTDDALYDYPFLYMIEPGQLHLSEDEVVGLRRYLLNGGFLMVDDFWGEWEYQNFYDNIKRVFPDREPVELPLEHEIFHCVYDLKEKPQVPAIHSWYEGGPTDQGVGDVAHYRAIFDDKGRMMALICHNTDLGDGWEREGLDVGYFKHISEKWSYPMGINIVTYAMTH